jgi:hypothetical protein
MSSSHVLIIGYSRQPEVGMGEFYNMGRVKWWPHSVITASILLTSDVYICLIDKSF